MIILLKDTDFFSESKDVEIITVKTHQLLETIILEYFLMSLVNVLYQRRVGFNGIFMIFF